MFELTTSITVLVLLVGAFWIGLRAQHYLHDHHRSRDTIDSIRVIITLLVTFAAVVLGLLLSSTQARFAGIETGLRTLSVNITSLDARLRMYGPAADPMRASLIAYTKAAISSTWPDEPAPPGDYPHRLATVSPDSVESVTLSAVLDRIDFEIRALDPADALHQTLAADLRSRMNALLEQRLQLIENARPEISWPFLVVVIFWLVVIFVIAGLSSSRNLLLLTVTALAALSLASSLFLTLELDTPLSGFIVVPSASLRDALAHITEPPLPAGAP